MKHFTFAILAILFATATLHAQSTNGGTVPEGFTAGSVVTTDNASLSGYVKNNLKKNGEIIFISADGKKNKYNASQLAGLVVDNTNYIVVSNAFYKVVADGSKIKLLRKASTASGIQYNGSEAIAVSSGEGAYDDYFIQTVATGKMQLVRKKDFVKVFEIICADCSSLTENIKNNKMGFNEIEQAVALYNNCGK